MAETMNGTQVSGADLGSNIMTVTTFNASPGNQPVDGLTVPQNNFPPPKTDKPRPHGCTTCGRSFARLEHLKRHERSHTKEKPFECPECTRCFARRDLLLRHQQKLHMTTTPAARPRAGRRESTSSNAQGGSKVRKNSTSQTSGSASMRPRANTISHADVNAAGFVPAANANVSAAPRKRPGHSTHPSLCGLPTLSSFEYRGMSALPRNRPHSGLPKIETQGLPMDLNGNLRTAPAFPRYAPGFSHDQLFNTGNTINPAQLHFLDSPNNLPFETPISPFHPTFNFMASPDMEDDGTFDWINGFDTSMSFGEGNENAIAESSPSAMSTGSPAPDNGPEVFNNMQNQVQSSGPWQSSALSQAPMLADYSMDMSSYHSGDMKNSSSPQNPNLGFEEHQFQPRHGLGLQSPHFHSDPMQPNGLQVPFMTSADTPTTTTASVGSSNRHSSVTSVCTDAITDATRAALIATLSQSGPSHQRKFSNPVNVAPKLGDTHSRSRSVGNVSLPSTSDLQRYIGAYIQYFHPHLPFLHIPTLSFNSPAYANNLRHHDDLPNYASGISGGGGCLILAMAAIGALYEFENAASKELFELAKKMIQAYLEERRKAEMASAMSGRNESSDDASQNTPLWLVQAMLLNVIYGHNSGDKMSADIASTHCAALVSLARAADLPKPARNDSGISMLDPMDNNWPSQPSNDGPWYKWKVAEERKRTLYAVYILSSMLVSAYNHSPALTNSEILLDLPCEEDIWAAESYEAWIAMGGQHGINARAVTFADALGWLLGASQRQPHGYYNTMRMNPLQTSTYDRDLPPVDMPISTFGCLVLIHSLHNYIWETRQRHLGRQWTSAETEAMHGHIEPALVAWQAAWASHPHHSIERPNPHGMGPLSADSIPLLDLAYVRLFVNLGRSKEAFWHRDWEQMAYEIARGAEIVQHADSGAQTPGFNNSDQFGGVQSHRSLSPEAQNGQSTRREKHMRKAAFHAALSLCTSDKLGVSFADFNSRELPIVSAMCAFDCAQVLAEWVTTVQERVGRYLGILGSTQIDFEAVPAIMLLDQEDVKLFGKIDELLSSMEMKQAMDMSNSNHNLKMNLSLMNSNRNQPQVSAYGSKILVGIQRMLEGSAVWPVIRVMARSLESQAAFMEERAMKSTHPEDNEQQQPQHST